MAGRPIMALALVGMPLEKLPVSVIRKVLQGGESVCAQAGIPVAGGHSIDTLEPIYGLVALGLVHPDKVKRNSSGRAGDVLILGKPLGIGILSAALKKGKLSAAGYAQMLDWTTRLNTPGEALGEMRAVHAVTDVTGFGLAGHLLEMCRGSDASATIEFARVPLHPQVADLARQGFVTGASARNWAGCDDAVTLARPDDAVERALLTDPQTSGGLLVACAANAADEVLAVFRAEGFDDAEMIGSIEAGPPRIVVR
jgi:selenide,water dikinase